MSVLNPKAAMNILIVDDEVFVSQYLETVLREQGYVCNVANTAKSCTDYMNDEPLPDLIFMDVRLPDGNGLDLLEWIHSRKPEIPIIVITAYGSISGAVRAMKMGAFDFIAKPFEDDNRIIISVKNALEHSRLSSENRLLKTQLSTREVFQNIIGESRLMKNVCEIIEKAAKVDSHILIEGESGTGKELVAEAIHNLSERKGNIFIPINCGVLSESLLESALFGYEKGAFTGAAKTTRGFFEEAQGGTLFLDEVGDASSSVQVKVLRAVESGVIYRVGGTKPVPINVRLIFATNKDLGKEVAEKRFRRDLYYRINIIRISLPTLRERKEDIPLLINHFLEMLSCETKIKKKTLDDTAVSYLVNRQWFGNIRELKNLIERVVALHSKDNVTASDLVRYDQECLTSENDIQFNVEYEEAKKNFEKKYFEQMIMRANKDLLQVSKQSGVHLGTIYRKIKSLGIGRN